MTITTEQLVSREVVYCVSSLVHTLAQGDGKLAEQAVDLFTPVPDYEEAAIQNGWTIAKAPGAESTCNTIWDHIDLGEAETAKAACDVADLDPYEYGLEVFEHWIVSDWLADKLEAKGERIDRDFAGLTIWGRTTTGQAIALDGVIEEIHADLIA